MELRRFREIVQKEFGTGLKHATPANVRDFLDRMQLEAFKNKQTSERIEISGEEPAKTYEEIIKDFFARILDAPPEDAVVTLWTIALDLSFAAIEYQYSDRFSDLFGEPNE